MPSSYFSFKKAYREGLDNHEKLLLFTLGADDDEPAETDRQVRRRQDVDSPHVQCVSLNKNSDAECQVTDDSVFAGGTQVLQSA